MSELSDLQTAVGLWHKIKWPDETSTQLGCVLAEESGEVIRCLLKLTHGNRPETDWLAELPGELADVTIAILAIGERFGIDVLDATREKFAELQTKDNIWIVSYDVDDPCLAFDVNGEPRETHNLCSKPKGHEPPHQVGEHEWGADG